MNNFQTKIEEIEIDGFQIRLKIITDIDQLFNDLLEKDPADENLQDERIPYWADLWPSSIALAKSLVRNYRIIKNLSVLEIGCGLGLTGIVAGKLGAEVTFTDYLPEALEIASENWKLNNESEARFIRMDWRHPDPELAADLILASDIAYEKRSFSSLTIAFKQLLKPGGKILISEPNRSYAKSFFNDLKSAGFSVEMESEKISFRGIVYKINLYELNKPGSLDF